MVTNKPQLFVDRVVFRPIPNLSSFISYAEWKSFAADGLGDVVTAELYSSPPEPCTSEYLLHGLRRYPCDQRTQRDCMTHDGLRDLIISLHDLYDLHVKNS